MASPITTIKISGKTAGGSGTAATFGNLLNMSLANAFRNVGSWFQGVGIGTRSFNGQLASGGVQATGTVTLAASVAADTVTINGTVFTEVASGATGNQFNHGASDTLTAANLAAAINGSATAIVSNNVVATSVGAVVTITMKEQGTIGNLGTLAISAHGSVSGATLTGGTDGTIVTLAKGI